MRLSRRASLALVLAATVCGLGCDAPLGQQAALPKAPRLKVNLPDTPKLELPKVRLESADGTLTVAGVMRRARGHMWKTVRVHGVVIDRQACEDEAAGDCHPPPSALLADGLDAPKEQLLVVGTSGQIAALEQGDVVTLEGRLVQWTDDQVFVRSEGLLELAPPPEPPPPAEPPPSDAAGAPAADAPPR
jgi:hypothetical protein